MPDSELQRLSLEGYRAMITGLGAPPDEAQQLDFVEHVSNAHSWYKHLPPFQPGKPFQFFLDPVSGMQANWDPDTNSRSFIEKPEGVPLFHYSSMPTSTYRKRFGFLNFSTESGTQIFFSTGQGVGNNKLQGPLIHPPDGRGFGLPREILEAGQTLHTGVITDKMHPRWLRWVGFEEEFIEVAGSREEPKSVVEEASNCYRLHWPPGMEQRLEAFIVETRKKEKSAMAAAIKAVIELTFRD